MAERLFGHVPGYPEGSLFENRAELSESRVHVPIQAGIAGSQTEGAESIVLSGGYEDDVDNGDTIVYTGHGGRDPHRTADPRPAFLPRKSRSRVQQAERPSRTRYPGFRSRLTVFAKLRLQLRWFIRG